MMSSSGSRLSKYLCAVLILCVATTAEADLLGDVASNVNQFLQPAQSAAQGIVENIGSNIGSNIASIADNAGNAIASAATHVAQDVDGNQENKINSELSKFESSGLLSASGSATSLFVALVCTTLFVFS